MTRARDNAFYGDINGNELILDADGDTSITSDTDDQIDIKLSGNDRVTLTSGDIDLKNDGTVSGLKLYCESSNAHYARLQSGPHSGYTSGNATLTLPTVTDTIVGRDTTDTLTNKTINSASNTITITESNISDLGSYLENVVEDTTPQLGGNLDLNGNDITGTGNIDITGGVTLTGDLTVNGTTTTINSTTLTVDDKNIELGSVDTPSDTTADGGGITLKGATDHTFNWVNSTDAWTSSEHLNLASGKEFKINNTSLKDVSETLTNKTLTAPVISTISNTGTLTLPTSTDTIVGRDTTDTLTNKTLTTEANTLTSGGNTLCTLQQVYPVGSIYINASVTTNPATLLGFGTWVAFGGGRVPVGQDTGDSSFNTLEETGGAKTHTLTISEMPSHTHETQVNSGDGISTTGFQDGANPTARDVQTSSTGGGQAHNNLQPYIVVKMWKRTA